MVKLATYNKLPPRPEYINKIIVVLSKYTELRPIDIERKTKLTKTQVMCSLDQLLEEGKIVASTTKPKTYSLS